MFTPPPSPTPSAARPSTSKNHRSPTPTYSRTRTPSPLGSPSSSPTPSPRTPSRYLSPLPSPRFPPSISSSRCFEATASEGPQKTKLIPPSLPLPTLSKSSVHHASDVERDQMTAKRKVGRRLKWAAILIPIAFILLTTSERWFSPSSEGSRWNLKFSNLRLDQFLGVFYSQEQYSVQEMRPSCNYRGPPPNLGSPPALAPSPRHLPVNVMTPELHHQKRQDASSPIAFPSAAPSATSLSPAPSASTTAATAQPLPTVPASAPTSPPVPTPFPQPFDSDISTNFSSNSCFNFFTDMLNRQEFRSCRPFGLLVGSSDEFLKAQNNLTLLNTLIWGTCNTNTASNQCNINMAGFATSLREQCKEDLDDGNSRAVNTLIALDAYPLMRNAGCQIDPSTNTYCFVNAVHNTNPADLYFYQLALGTSFPRGSDPTCSACARNLMSLYADALQSDGTSGTDGQKVLTGLRKTYDAAAQRAVSQCGAGYAMVNVASSASSLIGERQNSVKMAFVLASLVWFALS
ncbi:hypothetical protein EYR40_011020 [Pleurotus pulmonarius]|nr:hypothetical protein EYR36_002788 [Pleurotus pulmonarius]KAF4587001.1 hypothetical protein EYR40_011020 [Pleurotus pulmonarius]